MTDEEYLEQIKNINPNKYPDKTLFWLRNLILRAFEKNLKLGIVSNYKNEENLIPESVVPFDNLREKYDNVAIYYSVMYRVGTC
ncbi:MAG: hypothetical protein IPP34_20030 [Bacteroidetes bacterium]|nr:hypothetical protein [Bacteroidota bacterium]